VSWTIVETFVPPSGVDLPMPSRSPLAAHPATIVSVPAS
jgi:hypothetical protein